MNTSVSSEQRTYIEYAEFQDTKLLATAGSGKTFCIIQRIDFLIKNLAVEPKGIYMLTFSKNAKDDFRIKVKKQGCDQICIENICTIDSFAYRMLGEKLANTIDVSLLSYAWMDEIENNTVNYLVNKYPKLGQIRHIFVDEAQDLNEVQYRILLRMKQVCTTHERETYIHLIGDPNQNIYQFRKSSDKFLTGYQAETFHLTKNYRSNSHIVQFSSHLRPYNSTHVVADKTTAKNLQVTFYTYDSSIIFEKYLLSIIKMFVTHNIPLHKCAILAPTRGYIRDADGLCKYKGLCHVANILFQHNIPFKQFYSDYQYDDSDHGRVKYTPHANHINLMTFTASKGLEWDYVIAVDANAHLITRRNYSQDNYSAEKYLLYVVCTRPRKNLLILTKSYYANPWFKYVPSCTYKISPNLKHKFGFFDENQLYNQNIEIPQSTVLSPRTLVNNLSLEELYAIEKQLRGRYIMTQHDSTQSLQSSQLVIDIPDSRTSFMSFYLQHLYYVYALGSKLSKNHHFIIDILNILSNENILVCTEKIITWYYEHRSILTWVSYKTLESTFDKTVTSYIAKHFDRSKPFNIYTLVDKFYDSYISKNLDDIKKIVMNYQDETVICPKNILDMSRLSYAIQTMHYFYIKQGDDFDKTIYNKNKQLIDEFISLAKSHCETKFLKQTRKPIQDEQHNMYFFIDQVDDNCVLNIKPYNRLSIKDILSNIITQDIINNKDPFTNFYTLQLLPPALYKYTIAITSDERKSIYNQILQKTMH
jgi:hypothetical protein